MNRFRQGTNHRVVLESVPMVLHQDEETAYFLNNLELKRPNIISRGTNNKYRLIGIQPQSSSSTTVIETLGETVTYTDDFRTPVGLIQESIPIELFTSTEALIVPKTIAFPVTELSLTLEPTVVSQPVPSELPVTYDSTCVSQAISTPIVSPVVSTHHHLSEYSSFNVHNTTPTFTVSINGEHEVSEDTALPIQIISEEASSIYLTPVADDTMEVGRDVVEIPEKVIRTQTSSDSQNQMRMEAQADGTFMLYMDDLSSEPIHLGPDTEVIQTDAFPVIPNEPFELSSEGINGETESFILLPIDQEGNSVLLPTSCFDPQPQPDRSRGERESTGKKRLGQNGISPSNLNKNKLMSESQNTVVTEKPKPFRYDLPEESDGFENDDFYMNVSHMPTVLPHLRMNRIESSMWKTLPVDAALQVTTSISNTEEKEETESTEIENEPINVIQVTPNPVVPVATNEDGIEETSKGTFKCKYCGIEARLRVGILNHINRCHKDKQFNCKVCDQGFELESMLERHRCSHPLVDESDAESEVKHLECPIDCLSRTEEGTDEGIKLISISDSTGANEKELSETEDQKMKEAPVSYAKDFSPSMEVDDDEVMMVISKPQLTSLVSPQIEKSIVNQKVSPRCASIENSSNQSDDEESLTPKIKAKVVNINLRKRKAITLYPNPQRIDGRSKCIQRDDEAHLSHGVTVETIEIPDEANATGIKRPRKKKLKKVETNKIIMTRSSSRCLRNSRN